MRKKRLLFCLLFVWHYTASGQQYLDKYIEQGLQSNQQIQQQQLALEKSLFALKEARTLFFPNVSLQGNYFLAGGGRTVDFPAGDLLNPVYGTLNHLTGSNNFPRLENQSILLNPDNFYDIRFRTSMPLLNLEIEYNRKIKQQQVSVQELEKRIYQRELVKDIKAAYFNYLQATQAISIYENALSLVRESKRINESLLKNGKTNAMSVIRADNEITRFQMQIETARENTKAAQAYFNFLLNKSASEPIVFDSAFLTTPQPDRDSFNIEGREELQQLNAAYAINTQLVGLSKAYIFPKLNAFIDLGSQGFNWQFDNKSRYYFFGLALQWDLFASGKNRYKIKQAQSEVDINDAKSRYVKSQLQLQHSTALNNYNIALSQLRAALKTQQSSEKYYNDTQKLYKQGQALFIEVLDAQNQWVQAQLQANITLFDIHTKMAEIERTVAGFNINKL